MNGESTRVRPPLGYVLATMRRHIELLAEHYDGFERPARLVAGVDETHGEARACRDFRKHIAWYFKGYAVGQEIRSRLALLTSLAEFDELVAQLDPDQPYPGAPAEGPRGRAGSPRRVALPENWLHGRELDADAESVLRAAELSVSGG